jgi:hypothetical protein
VLVLFSLGSAECVWVLVLFSLVVCARVSVLVLFSLGSAECVWVLS